MISAEGLSWMLDVWNLSIGQLSSLLSSSYILEEKDKKIKVLTPDSVHRPPPPSERPPASQSFYI
jgi:hypothetical protein